MNQTDALTQVDEQEPKTHKDFLKVTHHQFKTQHIK